MGKRGGFDNTEIVLTFSRQDRPMRRDETTGAMIPGGHYFRCIPDMSTEVSMYLPDAHMIFDPETGVLTIARNRNAR